MRRDLSRRARGRLGSHASIRETAGRIENSQIGVFLTYATGAGRTFLDRELYLPKAWTDDRDRCAAAGIPEERTFATKPELAIMMLTGAHYAGVPA